MLGQTGIGYTRGYLAEALNALEDIEVVCWSQQELRIGPDGRPLPEPDPSWRVDGLHVCIDQPMTFQVSNPWHAFMPFFELPPRPDELPKLRVVGKRKMLCCNEDIRRWVAEANGIEDLNDTRLQLAQLGADVLVDPPGRRSGTIVTVGKAEPRKGTRLLLRALKKLQFEGAYLAITSPLHQQVEIDRLQDYCDADGHQLMPFTPAHEDVQRLLASCHVAVFPACAEGWNLGLTEALAQGCIVVASDIAAHRHQRQILVDAVGEEEVAKRWVVVPTSRVPMTHHQRWYPPMAYPNVKWDEPNVDDLAEAIGTALEMPVPTPWTSDWPLSWKNAALRLMRAISS